MDPGKVLQELSERFKATANVNVVYGESRVVGEKTIIPVALVSYFLGAGGGKGKTETGDDKPPTEGEGGGGGGRVTVKPIAVLEITAERTRIIPVLDVNRVLMAGVVGLGFTLFLLSRLLKRRREE